MISSSGLLVMDYQKINDQIYYYTDKTFYDVVAGAIVLPNKLVMIDSGIHLMVIPS